MPPTLKMLFLSVRTAVQCILVGQLGTERIPRYDSFLVLFHSFICIQRSDLLLYQITKVSIQTPSPTICARVDVH